MLRRFSRKYYNFKTEFAFFIKSTKKQPLFSKWLVGKQNQVLKRMLELFLEIRPLKKILKFHDWKKAAKIIQKPKQTNFKPEIKPIIENLQDELYLLQSKQAKGAKLCADTR